jgi:hypothetical protein
MPAPKTNVARRRSPAARGRGVLSAITRGMARSIRRDLIDRSDKSGTAAANESTAGAATNLRPARVVPTGDERAGLVRAAARLASPPAELDRPLESGPPVDRLLVVPVPEPLEPLSRQPVSEMEPPPARSKDAVSKTSSELSSPFAAALTPPAGAEGIRDTLRGKHVCPFCGSVNDSDQGTCPRCTMENSAATRKATKTRIGPWYVLQTRNPAAPGMTWETLVGFVRKGRVKPRSIVRGPTTHQLWRFAAHVKGLSREFGICYSCGTSVESAASVCRTCNRLQDPPPNPDALLETSRESAGPTYAAPPPTIAGAVPPTIVGLTVAEAPPPEDAEFVIPPFDAGGGAGPDAGMPTNGTPTTGGTAARTSPDGNVTAAGGGPTAGNFQGISGDTTWARIPNTPRERVAPAAAAPQNGAFQNGFAQVPAVGAGGGRGTPGRGANGAAVPPAQRFNPYDADDDQPAAAPAAGNRRADGDAGFLSPKELAAAFNLSFVGEEEEEPVYPTVRPNPAPRAQPAPARAPVPPRNAPAPAGPRANAAGPRMNPALSSGEAEAAMEASFRGGGPQAPAGRIARPPAGRRSRGNFVKILVALLFLGGAGLGVALAVSADARKIAREWVAKGTAALNKTNEGDRAGSPGSSKAKKGIPDKADDTTTDPVPPEGGTTATDPRTPASGTPGTAADTPTPPRVVPGAAPEVPAGLSNEEWRKTEAYRLYAQALALEQKDPALALARYKSIKRQPKNTWPNDLDACTKRAEDSLAKLVSQ